MRRRAVLAAAAAAFCAGSVVAVAADGDTKLIIACVDTADGGPRIVEAASQCIAGRETSLSWNAVGQQGPAGPQGAAGPAGSRGEPGSVGAAVVVGATAGSGDSFDPADLPKGDQKAFRADNTGKKTAPGTTLVSAKKPAVATCDPVKTPVVPGQCKIEVRVVDYLACPRSHPRVLEHAVAPYPKGYSPGADQGRGVPLLAPYAGYAFNQVYELDPLSTFLGVGLAFDPPAVQEVDAPPSPPSGNAATDAIQKIIDEAGVGGKPTVRGPGYKPVPQKFGVREYLTCQGRVK